MPPRSGISRAQVRRLVDLGRHERRDVRPRTGIHHVVGEEPQPRMLLTPTTEYCSQVVAFSSKLMGLTVRTGALRSYRRCARWRPFDKRPLGDQSQGAMTRHPQCCPQ